MTKTVTLETVIDAMLGLAPAVAPTPVYWADPTNVRFHPKRGFELELYKILTSEILTPAELTERLLSSGAYHRVAPKAAALRPHRPVNFLLKTWTEAGLVRRSS